MLKKQFLKNKPVCKVTFSLPVEAVNDGSEVRVVGDFNDWNWEKGLPMQLKKNEYTAVAELATGRAYEFRYLVNNARWENDWQADAYAPSPFLGADNSVIFLVEHENAASASAEVAPEAAPAAKKAAAPKAVKAVKAEKDDLKKVEGIGPKIQTLLEAEGIRTFADLAKADVKKLKAILEAAGSRYKMHDPATWPQQAKLAQEGKWEALEKLQDELKGGKR